MLESRQALESRLRSALTSHGKSAKFPLVSLDSVGNLVISCWPPPPAASIPPASSHPSINPVQPWISAQRSRDLDSPTRAEFPGCRTSCAPRGDVSTEGRFGPVAESKALRSSNCVGTWGGSVGRQMGESGRLNHGGYIKEGRKDGHARKAGIMAAFQHHFFPSQRRCVYQYLMPKTIRSVIRIRHVDFRSSLLNTTLYHSTTGSL